MKVYDVEIFNYQVNDKNSVSSVSKVEYFSDKLPHNLWFTKVFFSGMKIQGNITPVINSNAEISKKQCQEIAKNLVMSDSAFVFVSPNQVPKLLSFSPFEELNFCIQTLLATASILGKNNPDKNVHEIITKAGHIKVKKGESNIWWVPMGLPSLKILEPIAQKIILNILNISSDYIVNNLSTTGIERKRLYIHLKSEENLHKISINSEITLNICQEYGLTGICLFVLNDSNKVREIELRVFTTSLDGREDTATGGAALGLLSYLKNYNYCCNNIIVVNQGNIKTLNRGRLFLKFNADNNLGEIGGQVIIISKGKLLDIPKSKL